MVQITSFLIISTAKSRKKKSLIPNNEQAEWKNKKIEENELEKEAVKRNLEIESIKVKEAQNKIEEERRKKQEEKLKKQFKEDQEKARQEELKNKQHDEEQ